MKHSPHTRSVTRRLAQRGMGVVTVAGLVVSLSACAGSDPASPPPAEETSAAGEWPSYYPSDYGDLVEAARAEGGTLTIYSDTAEANWAPIFREFTKKYPFVTIAANDLGSDELFQRQLSEMATGNAPADIIAASAVQGWANYNSEPGRILEYRSPEIDHLPDFAEPMPNIYTISADPIGIIYNIALLGGEPTGLGDLAEIIKADPAKFEGKVTSRDLDSYGFTVAKAFVDGTDDAWSALESILPVSRPETSTGTQAQKVISGEYVAGFFISASVGFPRQAEAPELLKFFLPSEGTVVLRRGMAITPQAPHVNTAKLFVDFVLSEEGQNAVAEGGLTAYRDGLLKGEGRHHYQEDVVDVVGEDAIIHVPYEVVSEADVKAFTDQWDGLLGK